MKRKTLRLICFPIIGFIVALFLAITIALGMLKDIITPLLSPPIVDKQTVSQASEEGEALAEDVMEEGAVLVKNNGVLPLDQNNKNLNVFGWGSSPRGWVIGGSGSGRVMSTANDNHYAESTLVTALNKYGAEVNSQLTDYYISFLNERPSISAGTLNSGISEFY